MKAIKYIEPFWDAIAHDEYREPFLGGGSVFLAKPLAKLNWINDLDKDLISFYKVVKDPVMCEKLVRKLLSLKVSRKQYEEFYFQKASTDFDALPFISVICRFHLFRFILMVVNHLCN